VCLRKYSPFGCIVAQETAVILSQAGSPGVKFKSEDFKKAINVLVVESEP
jgi:hypothetical protein